MAKRDYEDGLGEKCMDAVRVEYERAKRRRADVIHPAYIAACAFNKIDPSGRAPIMAKYAARQYLRRLATSLSREQEQAKPAADRQQEMFDGLQPYYPCKRSGEAVVVRRDLLTLEERLANIARLRAEAESKAKHADALQAETDALMAQGYFEQKAA